MQKAYLGALIIDEFQNIRVAKSGGIDKMNNFLASLVNKIGIPIVLIGLPEAVDAISKGLMNARRNIGQQGAVYMDILSKNTEEAN